MSGERMPPKNKKKSKAMTGSNNSIDSKAEKHVDPLGESMEEGGLSFLYFWTRSLLYVFIVYGILIISNSSIDWLR